MSDTTTPAPGPHTADRIGHILIGASAVLQAVGGKLLRGRNEELSAELDEARRRVDELGTAMADVARRHYHEGRAHEAAGLPVPAYLAADVDERQGAELGDERQGADVTAGQNPPLERSSDQPADVAPLSADRPDRVAEWAGKDYTAAAPGEAAETTAAAGL